jgi:3-methyladenine DNA glycosylase AlkD
MADPRDFIRIRNALVALADPVRAVSMRAYLRDQFPFLGIASPARRAVLKSLRLVLPDHDSLWRLVERCWQEPQREYRHVAIDLLAQHPRLLSLTDLPALRALALREPWWESVDGLSGVVGKLLRRELPRHPGAQAAMDRQLRHKSFWIRRTAMIHQLGWRLQTDETRLFAYADALAPEPEFFIRKAIGWALRDYARWNPRAVRSYLRSRGDTLSALTRREAGKHLG